MVHLLFPMDAVPPERFREFVARHLPDLRRDATQVVGTELDADQLYSVVLIDVAAHWTVLELMRRWLRRPDVEDSYLRRAFARRSQQWPAEPLWPMEIEVWDSEVPHRTALTWARPGSTAATRLARFVRPTPRDDAWRELETTVAWLRAHQEHLFSVNIARLCALGLIVIMLFFCQALTA